MVTTATRITMIQKAIADTYMLHFGAQEFRWLGNRWEISAHCLTHPHPPLSFAQRHKLH